MRRLITALLWIPIAFLMWIAVMIDSDTSYEILTKSFTKAGIEFKA